MISAQASESQALSLGNSDEPKMRRGRNKAPAILVDITNLADFSNGGSTSEVDKASLRSKVCLIFAILS